MLELRDRATGALIGSFGSLAAALAAVRAEAQRPGAARRSLSLGTFDAAGDPAVVADGPSLLAWADGRIDARGIVIERARAA